MATIAAAKHEGPAFTDGAVKCACGSSGRMVYCIGRKVPKMGLNIKNAETHRLAEELAKRTGESLTTAVTTAVRERLDRVRREQGASLADCLSKIRQDCAKRLKEPYRSADHDKLLYDDRGLPR